VLVGVSDQSVLNASEGIGGKSRAAQPDRRIQGEPHLRALLSSCGARGGPGYEHYLSSIGQCGSRVSPEKECVRDHGAGPSAWMRGLAGACSEKLGGVPVLTSDDYNMYEMVSNSAGLPHDGVFALSRDCDLDAGAGGVGGITMDERIRNLMNERGHQEVADECGRSRPGRRGLWRRLKSWIATVNGLPTGSRGAW